MFGSCGKKMEKRKFPTSLNWLLVEREKKEEIVETK